MKNKDMFEEFMEEIEKCYERINELDFREDAKIMKGEIIEMGGGWAQVFSEEGYHCYLLGVWKTYRSILMLGDILKSRRNLRDILGSEEDEE